MERVAQPVAGIDRYSAPVAYGQILGWGIHTASAHPTGRLDTVLQEALDNADMAPTTVPDDIPAPPDGADGHNADELKQRVAHAISLRESNRQPEHVGSG